MQSALHTAPIRGWRGILFAAAICCAAVSVHAADGIFIPMERKLSENWRLQSSKAVEAEGAALSGTGYDDSAWYATSVPKTVLAALVENGVYPDPYYGRNLQEIPGYKPGMWHCMEADSPFRDPWWYRTEFDAPAAWENREVTLHFGGINLCAEVWLNGEQIADSDTMRGMFRRFAFPVSARLRYGAKNVLAVKIIPPGLVPDKNYRTKQIQATTGWDDHNPQPPDMNMGIWEEVRLSVSGPVVIEHPYAESDLALPGLEKAALTVSAFLTNRSPGEVTASLTGRIENIAVAKEITLGGGETREVIFAPEEFEQLNIENPRVWWPHPLGPQELYDLKMRVMTGGKVSDNAAIRFGIRDITSHLNEEDWRQYMVNGRKVLIRGGAWMTSDMLLNLTERRYDGLIRYARHANFNMLRSEGFSIRETEQFYSLCDEYGVMVTQQIFGRSIPDEGLAIDCIEDMMLRIRHHPSLAHFLGHDETHPTATLNQAYLELIDKYRVDRSYQPHSGTFFIVTRKETGGTRTGTRELWTYAGPSHYYHTERMFDVAWGFAQSGGIGGIVAPRDSLREMMPEDALWPVPGSETFSFHMNTQGEDYYAPFYETMNEKYGEPADIEGFCKRAYAMNYNSARGMYEAYGRNKYKATGITTWKYNAAWPASMTWQYIDWYLRPTAAYYGAKKACEPLHVQYAYDDEGIWVLNTLGEGFSRLKVRAALYDFDMNPVWKKKADVSVGADGKTRAFVLEKPADISTVHFLVLTLDGPGGEEVSRNFYWLSTSPDTPGLDGRTADNTYYIKHRSRADFTPLQDLPVVTLDVSHEAETAGGETRVAVTLKNDSPHLAFMVRPALLRASGGREAARVYWDDNCFSMLPGETRVVNAAVPSEELKGAPELRIDGWNIAP
jgi:exo-1,4-beta-D-glucosaminidase